MRRPSLVRMCHVPRLTCPHAPCAASESPACAMHRPLRRAAAGCPSHAHAGRRRPGHPAQRAADAAAHSAHPGAAWAMDRHRPERGQARCRRGAAHVPGGEPRGSAVAAAAGGRRWRLAHSAAVCCARERLVTRAVIGFVVPTGRRKDAHGVRGPRRGTVPRYARRACDDRPQRGPPGAVPRPAADHCHKRSILRWAWWPGGDGIPVCYGLMQCQAAVRFFQGVLWPVTGHTSHWKTACMCAQIHRQCLLLIAGALCGWKCLLDLVATMFMALTSLCLDVVLLYRRPVLHVLYPAKGTAI
eukprot:364215-Chlamydomonas_euryale.AAC.8